MSNIVQNAAKLLPKVRKEQPLVHLITNYVTAGDCANIVLAVGGSPVMADALEEAEDIIALSSALVLNMGTLNERTVLSMLAAGKKANRLQRPVLLDPVGAGASAYRAEMARKLLEEVKVNVVRGNASEIGFLIGAGGGARGVDASPQDAGEMEQQNRERAAALSKMLGCTVALTGATDVIAYGNRLVLIKNGHSMMARVTGTGCMASALTGTFCGAGSDVFLAAAAGILCMGIAGEIAFEAAGGAGTGSYRIALMDAISGMDANTMLGRARLYED